MSGKLNYNLIALFLLLIISISSSVGAISEEFNAFSPKETINMCACELTEEKVQLHNTGAVTSTYMVFNKGEAKEWVDIAPATFFLEPGETKEIKQFIKVPCSAQGEYNLNTTIKTLFDTEKTIQQKLNVQNCPNVKITPLFSGIQQECPCTPVQYSFEVLNIGNHIETYEISVEPHSEAIALSLPILILEPGEKQTVDVFINLPCGEYGEKIFTFNAKAQGTQILGQLDFALNIDKCYEYDVAMADEYNICEGVPNIIPYQVQNNAEIANTYFIETTGLDWVQPENNTISAWGKEIIDSNIVLFPPVTQEGDDVNIFAVRSLSTRGEEIVEKEIIVTSQKCYNYQFAETEIHLTECEKQETGITIQNTGSREGTYTIYTEGPEWFNTLNENVLVQTEEILTLPISAEVPCEVGEYPLNVYTTIEEINQTYLEEKKIVVHSKEEAHLPQIEIPEITLWYDGIEELIQITNVGYKETTYDLGLVTGNWVTINTPTVTLQPGETTTVILAAYPTEDVIQDTYAAELIATVRGEPIEYAAQFELTIGQESPLMKYLIPILIASSILIILIIVVLALLLTGKKTDKKIPGVGEEVVEQKPTKKTHKITEREYAKKTKKGKKSIWPWVIGIFIILALLGAAFYGATTIFTQQGNETVSEEVVDELTELEKEIEELENTVTEVSEEAQEPEVLTNEHIVDSLISIDRSAVQGKGNEIIVDSEEQITLPMIIKNPTERKAKLEITSPESDWIEFERTTIAIKAESEEIVNVIISPKLEELAENDYSAKITALLEGQKIYYEEELELVVTKKKKFSETVWPWILSGIAALILIIVTIFLLSKIERKPKDKKTVVKETKKADRKERKQLEKESKGIVLPIIIGLIILAIIGGVGFWAYTLATTEPIEQVEFEGVEDATEQPAQNEKLTEDDVDESLIVIDRSMIPGDGNELEMEQETYYVPISVSNPTERKAIFKIDTENSQWISFEKYKLLLEPETTTTVNMTITPDQEVLKEKDYTVSLNATLYGQKIDYEENLNFVLKNPRSKIPIWAYILGALVIIGLIVLIVELVKISGKTEDKSNKKPAKKKAKKSKKAKVEKNKDLAVINKDLSAIRKKIGKRMKKISK